MNLATLISTAVCFVGLLFAAVTYFISQAPGLRGLRVFSATCAVSALYAASNAALASPSVALSRASLRVSMLFIGLQGATWYLYTARREGRRLRRFETVMVVGAVASCSMCLWPNLLLKEGIWIHGVPALGITYLDARATLFGNFVFAYCLVLGGVLMTRSLIRFRRAGWTERAEAAGLVALFTTGINDTLVSASVTNMPYLLDIGFLILILFVGTSLGWRFIQNAQALEFAQHELIERERLAAVGEMSAVVAHEVRSPTAVIFNAAALLRRQPDESEKLLSIIEEEAGRLKRLVDDFLEFARPVEARLASTDLRPTLESVAEGVKVASGDTVDVWVDMGLPEVEIDIRLVRQALMNLVTNAVQSERRTIPVCVTATRVGASWVRLSIIDDGAGVPRELGDRIYLPFFTTRSSGTGLGLPFVQRIAKAHGGRLSHAATEGGGATFLFDLPINAAARDAGWPPADIG